MIEKPSNNDNVLNHLIKDDMGTLHGELSKNDEQKDLYPIVKIYKDCGKTRCYALDADGGIVIIADNEDKRDFKILTLTVDDDYHFLSGDNAYETYYGNKLSFVNLVSLALSLFNENVN